MTVRRMIFCGVAAVVMGGCASGADGNDGETHFLCAADPDCPSNEVCRDQECVPREDSSSSGGAGGGTGGGGSLTCDEQTAAGAEIIAAAFESAAEDLSCATDEDCVIAHGGSECTHSCRQAVVSIEGAQAVQAAIDNVDQGVCADFAARGCLLLIPPCASPPLGAACVDGFCAAFLPEAWMSFGLEERRGADAASSSTPPRCLAGQDCTLWMVTPDGRIEKTESGATSSSDLSPADFSTIDGILRSVAFRSLFVEGGPTCDAAPSGVRVSMNLENEFVTIGQDVTGCALTGPADNDVMRLYDVMRRY